MHCYNKEKAMHGGIKMKMNEAIRYFRLQNHLTQEQVASRLGVTAPAVNKWEKGVSLR